jgi:hypothetical protein
MPRYIEDKPRETVYTGILAISLLILVVASALLWFDKDSLGTPPQGKLNVDVPGAGGTPATPKAAPQQ